MKKSKIIVPALGILVLSTAASITGTVAWFTANNTYHASAGNFAVVDTSGGFSCSLSAGVGTSASGDVVSTLANYTLTDASFDHTASHETITAPDRTGTLVGKHTALSAAADSTITRKYNSTTGARTLSAMTFNMAFSMEFGADDPSYALFFNAHDSAISKTDANTAESISGFRMAFVGQTASVTTTKVWADQQAAANCSYITYNSAIGDALADSTGSYGTNELMDSTYDQDAPSAAVASSALATSKNYLGTFTFAANTIVTINFKVVVWFEGTDPNVITDKKLNTVSSELHFTAQAISA